MQSAGQSTEKMTQFLQQLSDEKGGRVADDYKIRETLKID